MTVKTLEANLTFHDQKIKDIEEKIAILQHQHAQHSRAREEIFASLVLAQQAEAQYRHDFRVQIEADAPLLQHSAHPFARQSGLLLTELLNLTGGFELLSEISISSLAHMYRKESCRSMSTSKLFLENQTGRIRFIPTHNGKYYLLNYIGRELLQEVYRDYIPTGQEDVDISYLAYEIGRDQIIEQSYVHPIAISADLRPRALYDFKLEQTDTIINSEITVSILLETAQFNFYNVGSRDGGRMVLPRIPRKG